MKKNKQKKEDYLEKYEKNIIIFGLFTFIILGVISFVFVMPRLYGVYDVIYKNDKTSISKNEISTNSVALETSYKSGLKSSSLKNYSSALSHFKKAVESEPNNISYLTELAATNYLLKNYEDAILGYNRILSLDKDSGSAYNSIGNIYWITEDYEKAEVNFEKAIEVDPSLISAYSNFALMLSEKGEKEKSIEILRKGIKESSENNELVLTLKAIE